MAFKLHKSAYGSTVPMERYIASGAVAADMPVLLAAGASGAELGKVSQLAGGTAATEALYGVAAHAAADGAEVLVVPCLPGIIWEADAVADTNVTAVAQANYLTSTTLTITVGSATNVGQKCAIIGKLGAAAARKYLVRFINTVGIA